MRLILSPTKANNLSVQRDLPEVSAFLKHLVERKDAGQGADNEAREAPDRRHGRRSELVASVTSAKAADQQTALMSRAVESGGCTI